MAESGGATGPVSPPTRSSSSQSAGACVICKNPNTRRCSNCHKVSYCGQEHQKQDWKAHKSDCFPAELRQDAVQGRYLVATRLIRPGEIFLKEKPLLTGQRFLEDQPHAAICLSCSKIVHSGFKCGRCRWPVCDAKCQNDHIHANFECGVFNSAGLHPTGDPSEPYNTMVLRGLLLRREKVDTTNTKWEQLRQLEAHVQQLRQSLEGKHMTASAIDFVQNKCGLGNEFDAELIEYIVGVLRINGFRNEHYQPAAATKSSPSYLYFHSSFINHNCSPNTDHFIHQESKLINFRACVPIQRGETISITYCPILNGTTARRSALREGYCFDCTCARCLDPMELGTHFSSVRCDKCCEKGKGAPGYLLPLDPRCPASDWKCNTCDGLKKATEISKLVEKVKSEVEKGANRGVEELEIFLATHQAVSLHPNHYLLLETENRLIHQLNHALLTKAVPKKDRMRLAKSQAELCRKNLGLQGALWPGKTVLRGRRLFYLQYGILFQWLEMVAKGMGTDQAMWDEIVEARKEGSAILKDFPRGCEEFIVAEHMAEDLGSVILGMATKGL